MVVGKACPRGHVESEGLERPEEALGSRDPREGDDGFLPDVAGVNQGAVPEDTLDFRGEFECGQRKDESGAGRNTGRVCSRESAPGFAPAPPWKQALGSVPVAGADRDDIHVSGQPAVLEAVVEYEEIPQTFLPGFPTCCEAVDTDNDGDVR
jgi:hypothetical protein